MSIESVEINDKNFWEIYSMFNKFEKMRVIDEVTTKGGYVEDIEHIGYNEQTKNYYVLFESDIGIFYNHKNGVDAPHKAKWFYQDESDQWSDCVECDTYDEAVDEREKKYKAKEFEELEEKIKEQKKQLAILELIKKNW
tara:strand:- start:648 stop:1064 length:417 start_codon:yes stop_codon:yes gene_type:complete